MSWLNKKVTDFHERRRKFPKTDLIYLTPQKREAHICNGNAGLNFFLQQHLKAANRCEKTGKDYMIVMDVELMPSKKFSWHAVELKKKGVKEQEIEARWRHLELLRGTPERKKPHLKIANYWENRREERRDAICRGAVASFAMAAADDVDGDLTFAAHCSNIINEGGGIPMMPAALRELLTHPSVIFINVNQYDDLDNLLSSFYTWEVGPLKYLEAESFFLEMWGPEWNGREGGKPRPTTGLINIVEKGKPGFTMYKNPKTTTSDWEQNPWSPAQKRYALEDVQFLASVIGDARRNGDRKWSGQTFLFPDRRLSGKAASKTSFPSAMAFESGGGGNNKLQLRWSDSEEDEDDEPVVRMSEAAYQRQKAKAAANPSVWRPMVEPTETEEAETTAGTTAETMAATVEADTSQNEEEEEEEEDEDACLDSDGYVDVDMSEMQQEARRVVVAQVEPEVAPPDSYEPMMVVTNFSKRDKRALEEEGQAVAPATTIVMVETWEREQTWVRNPVAEPPSKRPCRDSPILLQEAEEVQLVSMTEEELKKGEFFQRFLNAKNAWKLLDSVQKVEPETLGLMFATVSSTPANRKRAEEVVAKKAPSFTREEKQRFLKKVAEKPDFLDMARWMEAIEWDEFDILMMVTMVPQPEVTKSLLSKLSKDLDGVLQRLDSWINCGPLDILPLLRQSPFMTPALESRLIRHVKGDLFRVAISTICAEHRLLLPRAFSFEGLAAKTGRLLRVISESGMSEVSFRRWICGMVDAWPEAEELVRVMLSPSPLAMEWWGKRKEGKPSSTLPCWDTNRDDGHLQQFDVRRVGKDVTLAEMERLMTMSVGKAAVVCRCVNDSRYPETLGAIMWQLPEDDTKYWVAAWDDEAKQAMAKLLPKELALADPCGFRKLALELYGIRTQVEVAKAGKRVVGVGNVIIWAKRQKREYCGAARLRPLFQEKDMDACFVHHLAWELDILAKARL